MSDERETEAVLCPVCGHPCVGTPEGDADSTPCSPLRCSAWKVIGRATAPHPITGAQKMLRLVDDGEGS